MVVELSMVDSLCSEGGSDRPDVESAEFWWHESALGRYKNTYSCCFSNSLPKECLEVVEGGPL